MNKHFLKRIRDNMPESLKYIAAPLIRSRLVKNKDFLKYYSLLENRELFSPEKIREYQLTQLIQILIHAYKNVPYYQELFDNISFDPFKFSDFKEIEVIPFLTRELIRENFDKLISKKKVDGGFYVGTTGGSTARPMKCLLDLHSIYKENAFIYNYRKKAGYRFEDKLVTFRGVEFGKKLWKYNPMYNELIISPFRLSKLTLEHYFNKINQFRPKYINGYLSSIYFFAKLLQENQLNLTTKLKGIFLISEDIDNNQRTFIEQFFKVKSITHYGHTERCILAEEIIPDHYKFDSFYGYTEQIPIEANLYSIVGTGFLNYTMPLVRYLTDDVCTHKNGDFSISGKRKSTNGLYGKNREYFGHAAFNFHNDVFRNVLSYQFVQTEAGKADLLIVINKYFKLIEMDLIQKEIIKKTNGVIDLNIKIVEGLTLTASGKVNMFNSNKLSE
jgi:phenylacetate-CoA ligase